MVEAARATRRASAWLITSSVPFGLRNLPGMAQYGRTASGSGLVPGSGSAGLSLFLREALGTGAALDGVGQPNLNTTVVLGAVGVGEVERSRASQAMSVDLRVVGVEGFGAADVMDGRESAMDAAEAIGGEPAVGAVGVAGAAAVVEVAGGSSSEQIRNFVSGSRTDRDLNTCIDT